MPRLAAFPKAFMQALCKDGTMKVSEWIDLASNWKLRDWNGMPDLLKCRMNIIGRNFASMVEDQEK